MRKIIYMVLAVLPLLIWQGCSQDGPENQPPIEIRYHKDSVVVPYDTFPGVPWEYVEVAGRRPSKGFDFPVGPPNASGYFKARGLLPDEHFGEDWNGNGGKNTDFGDLVHAVADGVVFYARDFRPGWGQVVRIIHNIGTPENPEYIESLYAHLASTWVKPGNFMRRGDPIGTIGDADGIYHAHLHFEMRTEPGMSIRWDEGADTSKFLSPTEFINLNRPSGN